MGTNTNTPTLTWGRVSGSIVLSKERMRMRLNTIQAAEKLGLSRGQVLTLVKNGVLTNVRPTREGAKKVFPLIEADQIREYLKTHGKGSGARTARRNGVKAQTHADAPAPS